MLHVYNFYFFRYLFKKNNSKLSIKMNYLNDSNKAICLQLFMLLFIKTVSSAVLNSRFNSSDELNNLKQVNDKDIRNKTNHHLQSINQPVIIFAKLEHQYINTPFNINQHKSAGHYIFKRSNKSTTIEETGNQKSKSLYEKISTVFKIIREKIVSVVKIITEKILTLVKIFLVIIICFLLYKIVIFLKK